MEISFAQLLSAFLTSLTFIVTAIGSMLMNSPWLIVMLALAGGLTYLKKR